MKKLILSLMILSAILVSIIVIVIIFQDTEKTQEDSIRKRLPFEMLESTKISHPRTNRRDFKRKRG
ncbi:MAG: hypothetical protein ABDH59_03860 [Fervidobacterium sp.]